MQNFNLREDYFDIVFELLMSEGYSLKNTFDIMANLDEEEILQLVDEGLKDMSDEDRERYIQSFNKADQEAVRKKLEKYQNRNKPEPAKPQETPKKSPSFEVGRSGTKKSTGVDLPNVPKRPEQMSQKERWQKFQDIVNKGRK